ncbi:hypothetical protein D3C77_776090 [compost metagenome]
MIVIPGFYVDIALAGERGINHHLDRVGVSHCWNGASLTVAEQVWQVAFRGHVPLTGGLHLAHVEVTIGR